MILVVLCIFPPCKRGAFKGTGKSTEGTGTEKTDSMLKNAYVSCGFVHCRVSEDSDV